MAVSQIVTAPLAYLFKFKAAYVFTYIAGLFYGARFVPGEKTREKRAVDGFVYTVAVIGMGVRILLNICPVPEIIGDLLTQWIKLFQGAALFIFPLNTVPPHALDKFRPEKLAGLTYEIYIVHEFFMYDIFTGLLPFDAVLPQIAVVCVCVILSAYLLKKMEKVIEICVRRFSLTGTGR